MRFNSLAWVLFLLLLAGVGGGLVWIYLPTNSATAEMEAAGGLLYGVIAVWLVAWLAVVQLVRLEFRSIGAKRLVWLAPIIFGLTIVFLWESLCRIYQVPQVILPMPSLIVERMVRSYFLMMADLGQTARAIGFGYVVGGLIGFVVALAMDRVPFLQRGLLPYCTMVSTLPIVGIAPIMVMWFGFDWQSKAAVVIIMVFFPMMVNMTAGLAATHRYENELLKTYGAGYWQSLWRLRLPATMPFVFNALKINTTLALIGAIVAEFFGTPIVGMGFRINSEVGRMNLDFVWATIVVASILGTGFILFLNWLERRITFWHPSIRNSQ
ncbi:MAG: ABC transporter permease [Candidatus Pacebacteria bacterium]|nr:ABC transporter permease [Candidatus Paceibacterota bacterium]